MECPKSMAALIACALIAGCTDQAALTDPAEPQFATAGNSGCYTVKFTTIFTPIDVFNLSGQLTGDLEGTADAAFDEVGRFTGVTLPTAGNIAWNITGGIVSELIGETFHTRIENRNVFLPGTSLVKNVGSLRATDGVEEASLTYVGETSLLTSESRLDFKGLRCP